MNKKFTAAVIILFFLMLSTGCTNYVGLNEMTIVAGIAVDKNESGNYLVSFEIIDISKSFIDKGVKSAVVESEGKTIFDAVRNARLRLTSKLYFGNSEIIIISKKIASNEGLYSLIDWFLRDEESRETVDIIISQEENAKDLFIGQGLNDNVISYEISKIIIGDKKDSGTVKRTQVYQMYNNLKSEGCSLTLPAFHVIINNGKPAVELNGSAVFKGDKLIGFLTAEESKNFLFAINKKKGGIFVADTDLQPNENIALEINNNKSKITYEYKDNIIKFKIKTVTSVFIGEDRNKKFKFKEEDIRKIKINSEEKLKNNILETISMVQNNYVSDIFGFGNIIYKKEPKLWAEFKNNWENIFKELKVEVSCEFKIMNTAYIK